MTRRLWPWLTCGIALIFYPLLNGIALVAIFPVWFCINSWEILAAE